MEGLLDRIEEAEEAVAKLEARLADPATYENGGRDVATLTREAETARERVVDLTTRWEELEATKAELSS